MVIDRYEYEKLYKHADTQQVTDLFRLVESGLNRRLDDLARLVKNGVQPAPYRTEEIHNYTIKAWVLRTILEDRKALAASAAGVMGLGACA